MITPKGKEPERIKKRMLTLFAKLQETFPDKVVSGLAKDHKKWDETALDISRELGYSNKNEFLEAYGFKVVRNEAGRPSSVDPASIIKTLQERYPNGSGFSKLDDLFAANPDLLPFKKTLMNKSSTAFGMPLGQYLKVIGLLHKSSETLEENIHILQERYKDRALPDTIAQLKNDNPDLRISGLDGMIRAQAKEEPIPYLYRHGLVSEKCYKKYSENDNPKVTVDEFVTSLRKEMPEGKVFRSYAEIKQKYPDWDWERIQELTKRAYPKTLEEILKEHGMIASKPLLRQSARYTLSKEKYQSLYCTQNGELKAGICEDAAKRLKYVLTSTCYTEEKREAVISSARKGVIPTKEFLYYVSENCERITLAQFMYSNTRKQENMLEKFPVGEPVEFLHDLLDEYSGLCAITKKDNILHHYVAGFRWLAVLVDLGKARMEKGVVEWNNGRATTVSYDIVFSEPFFIRTDFCAPDIETLFEIQPYSLPQREPIVYQQQNTIRYPTSQVYFTNGAARGIESDLKKLAAEYPTYDEKPEPTKTYGIFELKLENTFNPSTDVAPGNGIDRLYNIMQKYPQLKVVGFFEDLSCGKVHVFYSDSGYGYITDMEFAGFFDSKADWSWQFEYAPTDTIIEDYIDTRTGANHGVLYSFPFKKQWDNNRFVIEKGGNTYLLKSKQDK